MDAARPLPDPLGMMPSGTFTASFQSGLLRMALTTARGPPTHSDINRGEFPPSVVRRHKCGQPQIGMLTFVEEPVSADGHNAIIFLNIQRRRHFAGVTGVLGLCVRPSERELIDKK